MPPAVLDIIKDNLETARPADLVTLIQPHWNNVTAAQIYSAWTRLSETLWKRHKDQLLSAQMLLEEFGEEVEIFDVGPLPEGVEMLCFGLKRILSAFQGQKIELKEAGGDATCK
jgi:hypothetical protein